MAQKAKLFEAIATGAERADGPPPGIFSEGPRGDREQRVTATRTPRPIQPRWKPGAERCTMATMKAQTAALALAAAFACFGAGLAAARLFGATPPPAPMESPAPPLMLDGGVRPFDAGLPRNPQAPQLVFDPDAIQLLPDASLRLTLPPGFDGGAP